MVFIFESGSQLGSSTTEIISIEAGSLGSGSNENGIQVGNSSTACTVQVGNGGTITMIGTGGGLYSNNTSPGGTCYGINISGANFTAGNGNSSPVSINFTGIGGQGSNGTNANNYGVAIYTGSTPFNLNLNSTSKSSSVNFRNCVGGSGKGNGNDGVNGFGGSPIVLTNGTLNFINCVGGTGDNTQTGNHGVYFEALGVSAPSIIMTGIMGGTASNGSNFGLYLANAGAVLGGSSCHTISVEAGSLGVSTNECGIYVTNSAVIQVGDGGTINLVGTGGGIYSGTGAL